MLYRVLQNDFRGSISFVRYVRASPFSLGIVGTDMVRSNDLAPWDLLLVFGTRIRDLSVDFLNVKKISKPKDVGEWMDVSFHLKQ